MPSISPYTLSVNYESYCADLLRLTEGEVFLAVGDQVESRLNPHYEADRQNGITLSFPDLLSTKRKAYRVREVKFKLEERLVRKAVGQLRAGARHLKALSPDPKIDRLEIVIPLKGRSLKPEEKQFLGKPLSGNRFQLVIKGARSRLCVRKVTYAVTVLLL